MPPKSSTKKKPQVKVQLIEDAPSSLISILLKLTLYSVLLCLVIFYGIFVYYPTHFKSLVSQCEYLQPLDTFFQGVEKYSPFHEFLDDDGQATRTSPMNQGETKPQTKSPDAIFTKKQLKEYDGGTDGKGPYLAVLGQVFDVSKGKDHYGPGGGYGFFSGIDGSRAFVTGEFNEKGLIDDVSGLSHQDYLGLKDWVDFYHSDYTYVGKLVGKFYDADGRETNYAREVQKWIWEAEKDKEEKGNEQKMFPSCNSEWSQKKGHRVWCTNKSGGISRNWVGRPRRLFYPGRNERCACVRDSGPPSTDPSNVQSNNGDLNSPHVKEYENCNPNANSCLIKPPEKEKDEL